MNAPTPTMQPQPPTQGPQTYPGGAEVMAEQQQAQAGADGQIENPVIAGFRTIMMLIQTLQQKGDPRAEPAAQHFAGLLDTLQGAPQEPPMAPPQPGAPPAGGPAPGSPAPGGQPPAPTPPPSGNPPVPPPPQGPSAQPAAVAPPPPPGGAGAIPMGPAAGAQGKVKPMQQQPNPQGKRPVVLT